jgi:hypothetical protein
MIQSVLPNCDSRKIIGIIRLKIIGLEQRYTADTGLLSWILDPDFLLSRILDTGSQIPNPTRTKKHQIPDPNPLNCEDLNIFVQWRTFKNLNIGMVNVLKPFSFLNAFFMKCQLWRQFGSAGGSGAESVISSARIRMYE